MNEELSFENKEKVMYELAMQEYFCKNYASLISGYLELNHDDFMEYVAEQYDNNWLENE